MIAVSLQDAGTDAPLVGGKVLVSHFDWDGTLFTTYKKHDTCAEEYMESSENSILQF